MLESGKIEFAPCHEHMCTGPMAGVISPSMLVYIIENKVHNITCYSNLNEGRGKVLRMGAYGEDVLTKLRWMEATLGPTVKAALEAAGGLDIRNILAKALHMGDDGHNRLDAASVLWTTQLGSLHRENCQGYRHSFRGDQVPGRERAQHPQPGDGSLQDHDRCRGECRGQHDRDHHVPQRHRLRACA